MAGREISSLGSTILGILEKIQELGNNWYKASQSWKDFPLQVERLRGKHKLWEAEFTEFGMLSDSALIKALSEAGELLKEEEEKLSRRHGNLIRKMVFPDQIGLSIRRVNEAYDYIPAFLKLQNEAAAELHNKTVCKPLPLLIRNDERYVHLEVSETALRAALDSDNSADGPAVVLLHGGPGRGKTTLARFMAVEYYISATGDSRFDHVVYQESGLNPDTSSKQLELLRLLGLDAADAGQEKGSLDPNVTILKLLTSHLRDQKLLLIFDDVWKTQFLQKMVDMCGCRVKVLVTSRLRDVCDGLNCPTIHRVQIQDIEKEDARKILASHVRLPEQHIPVSHEEIADKIIKAADANPLALACIASAVDQTRSDEVEEWGIAAENLFRLLHVESTAQILGKQYPTSFWSAMKLCLQSLTNEQKILLILIHMCDVPSIPEEVIHILERNTTVKGNPGLFAISRKELESRQLVSIIIRPGHEKHRLWSLHSLHKNFIEEEMRDAIESTFTSLSRAWDAHTKSIVEPQISMDFSEDRVAIALSALYYREQFAKPASSNLGVPFEKFTNLRRTVILPVTLLLARGTTEDWTEALRTSARRVFLKYICYGVLDDKGISELLASTVSIDAMLAVLYAVSVVEKSLLDENTPLILNFLTDLLGDIDGDKIRAREQAARVLRHICEHFCHNDQHDTFVVSRCPGVLEAALRTISTDSHYPRMQSLSCSILLSVSGTHSILKYSGALACLVKSLSIENNPMLNEYAAGTLANLSQKPTDRIEITNSPGALEGLVRSLSKFNNAPLQEQVSSLSKARLQRTALTAAASASALLSLALGDDDMKSKIANIPGTLEELVHSVSKENNPDLQVRATGALAHLAQGDNEVKSKIANVPGALEVLVHSISKDNNLDLQAAAALTLANLAHGDDEIKSKIANIPGAREELVQSLYKDNNVLLQKAAANVLDNLARGDSEMKSKLSSKHSRNTRGAS